MSAAPPPEIEPIPAAPVGDLDLDNDADEAAWERSVMALAEARLAASRERLQRLGIVDERGDLVSAALPPDMLPDSDATLETG